MRDEATSDAEVIHLPDATAPKIRTEPTGSIFEQVFPKEIEKPVSGADSPLRPDATPREIKLQPADSIRGRAPLGDSEKASAQDAPLFIRLLRYGARGAVIVFLCALAWAAGAYYSLGHSPFEPAKSSPLPEAQQSPSHDEMTATMQQMTAEIRGLKTSVDGRHAAQDAGADQKPDSAQTATSAMITDLAGRIDKMDAEFTTKLSELDEKLASIEKQIAASHATLAARAPVHKHPKHLHDAFDPARDPAAPGAPRPLDTGAGDPSRF